MAKKTIKIIDDDEGSLTALKTALEAIPQVDQAFEVGCIGKGDFKECLDIVEGRRSAVRQGGAYGAFDSPLDLADILVVDYDLLGFDDVAGVPTGERVAYLARCYSRCGAIVGLNQFGRNSFDLTLRGNLESFADLNIGVVQVANESLWLEDNTVRFHPWHWPNLTRLVEDFHKRFEFVANNLDTPVLAALNFSSDNVGSLPREISGLLSGMNPHEATFRQVISERPLGKAEQDKFLDDETVARVAAARVFKWLERAVRPGQDILVDAPHLVSRFPSLLVPGKDLQMTTRRELEEIPLDIEFLGAFAFDPLWADRPLWFWSRLKDNEAILEVKKPFEATDLLQVFCEDVSRFGPLENSRGFVADVSSPFMRRFVSRPEGFGAIAEILGEVDYVPAVRLAM